MPSQGGPKLYDDASRADWGEGGGGRKRKERPPHRLVPIFAEIVDDIYRRLLKSWVLMTKQQGKSQISSPHASALTTFALAPEQSNRANSCRQPS